MRIAVVYLGRHGAGGAISHELAIHLSALAEVFAVISSDAENRSRWHETGLPLLETSTYTNLAQALSSFLFPVQQGRLAHEIRRRSPDVLLFPMFHTWTPFLQKCLQDLPSVVTVHDPAPHPGDLDWLLENLSIRRARRCILHSASLIPALVQRGVPEHAIDVIPLGEMSYYRSGPKIPAAPSDPPIILFFGRIEPYKGLEVLLRSYRLLVEHTPARLKIVGAGNLSPYASLLEGLPGVEVVNRWIAEDEVAAYFHEASLLVLPYTSASQSGVLPVAAVHGLPVVASRLGGLPEQIQDGISGLLVAPGSPEELSVALHRLLREPDFARQLGDRLRTDFNAHNNWPLIANLVLETCQKAALPREHNDT